jgi:hypothetical protein
MKTPLVPEERDPRGVLERNVPRIFEQLDMRKIVSEIGIKALNMIIAVLKVVMLAMRLEAGITVVISELNTKASLREFR